MTRDCSFNTRATRSGRRRRRRPPPLAATELPPQDGDVISVNVGGENFCTRVSTLRGSCFPPNRRPQAGSLLRRLADRDPSLPRDSVGRPFADAYPALFSCILNFVRFACSGDGDLPDLSPPPGYRRSQLCWALDFWGAPHLRRYIDPTLVRVILRSGKVWKTVPDRLEWLEYEGGHLKAVRWTAVAGAFLARGYVLVFWTPGTTGTSFVTYPTYAIFAKS